MPWICVQNCDHHPGEFLGMGCLVEGKKVMRSKLVPHAFLDHIFQAADLKLAMIHLFLVFPSEIYA